MTCKTAKESLLVLLACLCLLLTGPAQTQVPVDAPADTIRVLAIDGAIGPALGDYIQRGIRAAQDEGVSLVVIEMDTPGGLDLSMRDIIQTILDARIPVATYVSPQGARAASAGTYILYASHIAAMAPATNLGAATPVQIGTPSLPGTDEGEGEGEEAQGGSAMERKMVNDATAYIRGLAELHGRNADWAVTAVTEAASLPASEALAENVIDIVARDISDLLAQMDGRQVRIRGELVTLRTAGKVVQYDSPGWRTKLLQVLTNPNLILILGMIGIYGLIIEFYSAGIGFAGILGGICLLLAGYGLQLLPLNYAGLGLIILGLGLMVAEALMPSFGIFGVGGIVAFSMGAIMLVDTELDMYRVSLPLVAAIAIFAALVLGITLRMFMKLRRKATVSGIQTFVGMAGESVSDFDVEGMVRVQGELWQARTQTPLHRGEKIKVLAVDGLHLVVSKA
ncbi:MAG: nodulation protein NfeD [Pseudomonadales bacterium]|nr:nodulation protein NfeD [Pseudomonadales bacterium]